MRTARFIARPPALLLGLLCGSCIPAASLLAQQINPSSGPSGSSSRREASRAAGAAADSATPPTSSGPTSPGEQFTGRDFSGLRLQLPTQTGPISLSATRAGVWTEEAPAARGAQPGQTVGDRVQRLLLAGDVRITLAGNEFQAAKASIWMEQLEPGLWQLAVYFDRVGASTGVSGSQQAGDRLLVTTVIRGSVSMAVPALVDGQPTSDGFLGESERAFARTLAILAGSGASAQEVGADLPPEVRPWEQAGYDRSKRSPVIPGVSRPFEPGSAIVDPILSQRPPASSVKVQRITGSTSSPLFSSDGVVTIAAGEPALVPGTAPGESSLIIGGGVIVQYTQGRADRTLQLQAQQAVVFLAGERPQDLFRTSADKVIGIYLEGDVVATDGNFTVRSPQVYYDFKSGTGSMVDAVFWTFDEAQGLPLYVRAKGLRQVSTTKFEAEDARVSTSAFFTPHLSVGAKSVTVTRDVPAGQIARTILSAKGVTANFGDMPFFAWPGFEGGLDDFPLKEVSFAGSSASGYGGKTRWNLFGLLGLRPIPDSETELLIDGFTKRGAGLGIDFRIDSPEQSGNIFAYMLPSDQGTDVMPSNARFDNKGAFRGLAFGAMRFDLGDDWSLFLQGASISDERLVNSYFQRLAETSRELTNAGQLRYLAGNQVFAVSAKYNTDNFSANQYLQLSQGYTVAKLPEISYTRVNDDLLPEFAPGLLTWNQEYRVSQMQMRFMEPTASEFGLNTNALAQQAFGINANQTLAQRLTAAGFTDEPVFRADTRQELTLSLDAGPVKLQPFVTGRATMYDDNFKNYSTLNGSTDENRVRLWGGAGLRATTTLQHIDGSVKSDLFDLSGVRHIVEPSVTVLVADTNRDSFSLPVYDERVESLLQGGAMRAGVAQTWQTRRGGPGREHTVDFLKVNLDYLYATDSTPRLSPVPRFFDARPEYSIAGKAGVAEGLWQVTDSTALIGSIVYDLDLNQPARTTAGVKFDHSADFSTFAEFRFLNAVNATYVDFGGQARLSPKYTITSYATYDTDRSEIQSVTSKVDREFPDLTLGIGIRYNRITDDIAFSVDFKPLAQDTRRSQLQRLRASRTDAGVGDFPESQSRSGWFGGQ